MLITRGANPLTYGYRLCMQRITDLKLQTEQRRMRRSVAAISGTDAAQDREHDAAEEHALAVIQQVRSSCLMAN